VGTTLSPSPSIIPSLLWSHEGGRKGREVLGEGNDSGFAIFFLLSRRGLSL